jgi:hypothetical protein
MGEINLTTVAKFYKTLQPTGIEPLVLDTSPFLGMMPKDQGFSGDVKQLSWRIDRGGGASVTFATAQANAGVPTYQKPNITRSRLYVVRKLDNESIEAAQDNAGAMRDLLVESRDLAIEDLKYRAGSIIMGDGSGQIGQISATSNVGTPTVTLSDITRVRNFRVGGIYAAFLTVAGGLRSAGATITLTGVNEETGQLTAAGNWSAAIAAVAAGDYLVPVGDFNLVPKGVFAWNPTVLPAVGGGDSFFGVDRGGSVRMAGCRFAPTSGSIDEVLMDAMALHDRMGGKHNSIFLNPMDFGSLTKQGTNWQRINKNAVASSGKEIASIGFNGVVMNGPRGAVNVFSEPDMPLKKFILTKRESWKLWSLKEAFRLLNRGMSGDGSIVQAEADGIELRWGGYWNVVNIRPLDSLNGTLPS